MSFPLRETNIYPACIALFGIFCLLASMQDVAAVAATPSGGGGWIADSTTEEQEQLLRFNNPGSIVQRLEENRKPKEYLFRLPGVSAGLDSWQSFKAELAEKYGLAFGLSYTMLYLATGDSFGPEDEAASFDLDISGTWTFAGRGTGSPAMLGFNFFWRDTLGTELPPQKLFTQYGSLYSSAAPYGEEDPVIGELYVQKRYENTFGFRLGKIFPITAYDFFPFKNFRTDFIDFNHVTNAAIPLPGNGLGGFLQYRPDPGVFFRLGVHDANADVQKSGFDSYDGELFTIFEAGLDTKLLPRSPAGPPQGHLHLSLWHQDERDEVGVEEAWGIGCSAVQKFGRMTPFLRYGYADQNSRGPTPVNHMINMGVVIEGIFNQANDRVGIGYTWSEPADESLDNQDTVDAYYRLQLTPEIQLGPVFELIFDPVRHPNEDTVFVGALRARINL